MEKFYLGMDIGTESVGIACTDEQYNLLRAKGKDLWAVRLFDEANDAKDRRAKRTARRRLQRRVQRIDWLQDIFTPFIEDDKFFLRLNNSGFYAEDKDRALKTKFSLFADDNYTDIEFYDDYPTIYHLRRDLVYDTPKMHDLRHYYLALHHIIKYRGHFLYEGKNISELHDIKKLFSDYNAIISEYDIELDVWLAEDKAEEFKALALSKTGKNYKKKAGIALFGATNKEKQEFIALILGASVSPKKLFGKDYEDKYKEEKSFSFESLSDEEFEAMNEKFEEEHFAILSAARAIYNYTVFEKVLGGNTYISDAMVGIYEKHKQDLTILKSFVKCNYLPGVYRKIFRSKNEQANYVNYIGYNKSKTVKQHVKKCSVEDFYKFLKKILLSVPVNDEATLNAIIADIEEKNFLPKILNADNGLFPHQINGMELNVILNNLCVHYPEFNKKSEDGYTPREKIEKLFTFKIPYYVGPLNANGENAWIKRKEGKTDKITPWNFNDVVDKAGSNEEFIRRMTNKCTYLRGKDVVPKGSMYYQAFDVLNQINKLTINSSPISVELKQEIFKNVYLCNKKVGSKQIRDYLVKCGYCTVAESKDALGGFDSMSDLKASMSSYVMFKAKFGDLVDKAPDMFENIILWHTLNTDKNLVEEMIKDNYGHISAIAENIKFLKGITSFKDFGRLSKELLCDICGGVDPVTGEIYTILNRLYNTNYNFNQLLYADEFTFMDAISNENFGKNKQSITYDDVKELSVPPMVRRGIWQALKMTDEYVNAVGRAPDKIFIEVTRNDGLKGDNGRKASRKNKILELNKGLGKDCSEVEEMIKELNREDMTDSKLRSERLYLYFLQLGRCAYTGNRINLEDLMGNRYDVDHIIPQSMTKDDSLDNKVLVERQKNAEKSNQYPLPYGFTNQQSFWSMLKNKGLISQEKYNRLNRTKPLEADDFRAFLNRQLVVTNQTVKAVADILKEKYSGAGTKIVYSKAKNVDDFKQKFGIVKCRETNDLHHARDAYLNIVVGNVYDTKFSSNYAYFYSDKEGVQRGYNLDKLFNWEIKGAWNGVCDIERIKKVAARTSMCVTRFSYINQGAFYDENAKNDGSVSVPRKDCYPYNQIEKYGGFKSLKTAYFVIVQSKEKCGLIKTIEAIPVLVDYQARINRNRVIEYLTDKGLIEPIIVAKLKVKSLVSINGYKVWISGVTGSRVLIHNAQQWFTDSKTDLYVKQLVKLIEKDRMGKLSDAEKSLETIPLMSNRSAVKLYANRQENLALYVSIINALSKKMYQGLSSVKSFCLKLQNKQTLFENLTTFDQCKVLLQIIRFMKCNAEYADLRLLNDGATCGKLLIEKNITNVDFSIIHQSPCGLVERVQKI